MPRATSRPASEAMTGRPVPPVEGVMDDDLAAGEELDMRTTDAEIGDLFVFEQVLGGNDGSFRSSLHVRRREQELAPPHPDGEARWRCWSDQGGSHPELLVGARRHEHAWASVHVDGRRNVPLP